MNSLSINKYIYTHSNKQHSGLSPVQTTGSDVVVIAYFCNLIGLHSWLQWNKSYL